MCVLFLSLIAVCSVQKRATFYSPRSLTRIRARLNLFIGPLLVCGCSARVAENAIILTQTRPTYCVTAWIASLESGSNSDRSRKGLAEVLDTPLAHGRDTDHQRERSTFTIQDTVVVVSAGPHGEYAVDSEDG